MTSSDRAMVDDLHRIIEIARRVQHGNETGRQGAREIEKIATSRVVLLASPVQGSEDVAELLRGPEAWLDRWATHIGTCPGGERCACGLTLARAEIHQALAAVSKPLGGEKMSEDHGLVEEGASDPADYDYPYDDDDGLDDDGNIPFECAAYWVAGSRKAKGYWHCPLAGSEECDWECPGHPEGDHA